MPLIEPQVLEILFIVEQHYSKYSIFSYVCIDSMRIPFVLFTLCTQTVFHINAIFPIRWTDVRKSAFFLKKDQVRILILTFLTMC